jgi:hypothetical protein
MPTRSPDSGSFRRFAGVFPQVQEEASAGLEILAAHDYLGRTRTRDSLNHFKDKMTKMFKDKKVGGHAGV